MIDDKKIEEAAINKCGFISSEFYSGAKWAINEFLKNLWHSVDEMPNENNEVICVDKDSRTITYNGIANWWAFCRSHDVTRWLYVDDLFPKEGESNERT